MLNVRSHSPQILLLFLLLFCSLSLTAQTRLKVLSFKELPEDQDARVNFPLKDETITGTPNCALVKIQTPLTGFAFESTYKVPAKIQYETAECWVYWPVRTTSFTIKHQQMGILNVNCPHALKPSTVYRLVLENDLSANPDAEIESQWVFIKVVDPPTARIYIDGVFEGTGEVAKKLRPDTYKYRIEAPLYHFDEHRFTVDKEKVEMKEIKMLPNYGFITINTTPENGAKVFIDDMEKGITPYTSDKIKSGTHTVKLLLNQYQIYETGLTVKDNTTTQESYTLQPNFSEITLLSQGASLYVNGEPKGTDRWSGRLTPGIYTIEARKPSHAPAKQDIEVIVATPQSYTLAPIPQYGNLDIMTTPMDVAISVDGENKGTTPTTLTRLLIGNHTVRLTKSGYAPIERTVDISHNQTATLNEKMQNGISVTINSTPIGAQLTIDGTRVGTTPYTGELSYGTHSLQLVNGKKRVDQTITLQVGGNTRFNYEVAEMDLVNGIPIKMILVAGGTFTMGSPTTEANRYDNETQHPVTLSSYQIGKYEVTQAQWKAVMGGENPSYNKGDNLPVEQVSWDDIQFFIQKLNALTGKNYRLPTEAEWEYAARGGNQSKGYLVYSGSNNLYEVAWYGNNTNKTHAVGEKRPNELGIYDMSGNVWEWCCDWYNSAYPTTLQTDPTGPATGTDRVRRGGSWYGSAQLCRSAYRDSYDPYNRNSNLGFRLVLSEKNTPPPSLPTFEMLPVVGGTFTMGSPTTETNRSDDETQHPVTLSSYEIGKYEVTQAQWKAVMGRKNPSYNKGDNLPVENVSWDDVQKFIQKLNTLTGKNYRLPTEAEWEYAARGGNQSKGYLVYSGSNKLYEVAWYKSNGGDKTHAVGAKRPNELGIYDMSGNVWEWCSDWYNSAYPTTLQTDPTGPATGASRVSRGGSWGSNAQYCRSAYRNSDYPYDRSINLGFRLVLRP